MSAGPVGPSFADLPQRLGDLLEQGARMGRRALESLAPRGPAIGPAVARMVRRTVAGGCEIPPACWLPQPLGRVVSHVCPGGTATVRVLVTNCDAAGRVVRAEASGLGGAVAIEPDQVALGPMEEGTIEARVQVPGEAAKGDTVSGLLWVRGCRDHFLRWAVRIGSGGCDSLHEVRVEDCPDLVHHWYDHFYCDRPCRHDRAAQHV